MVVGEVANVASAGCGDSGFDGGVGLLAGLNAVEEVSHVGIGPVLETFFFERGIAVAFDAFAINAHAGAIELERRFGSAELEAAIVDG